MKSVRPVLAASILIGSSLLLGSVPAHAAVCPVGQHWNEMGGGSGFCSPDASGGGSGGSGSVDLGGSNSPAPQAPVFQNPNPYQAPVYGPAPVQAPPSAQLPANPGPAVQAPGGNLYGSGASTPGQGSSWAPAGNGGAAPSGQSLQSVTPVAGQVTDGQPAADAAAASEAAPAEAPPAAPAVVLPTTEVQAVDALRSATATPTEKDAALAIVKSKIDAVLTAALNRTLSNH